MYIARASRRPILVSAWSNRTISDSLAALTWPAANLILQPDERSRSRRAFFPAVVAREDWPTGEGAVLGHSVIANLHPVTVEAIAELIQRRTGKRPLGQIAPREADHTASHLADWLKDAISGKLAGLSPKRAGYFCASGAQRARAIATALRNVSHRPFKTIVDCGSGVGMIPWLLRRDIPSISAVHLFEPDGGLRGGIDRLWTNAANETRLAITHTRAEEADFRSGADLITFCQCLFLTAPAQRGAVLQRAWNALNPGGVLLVNEKFADSRAANTYPDMVGRDELIGLMPGDPRIFTRRTGWSRPQNPHNVSARAAAYTGIMIAVRA